MKSRVAPLLGLLLLGTSARAQPAPPVPKPVEIKIEPTFEDLKETTFAGVAAFVDPGSPRIPELWNKGFESTVDQPAGNKTDDGLERGGYSYGLELFAPNFEATRKFTYMACLSVSDAQRVPLHLVQRTVPACQVAVFRVPGGLAGLGDSFNFIYNRWLPNSGFHRAYLFDMERYDTRAVQAGGQMVIDILVPVVPLKK